MLIYKVSSQHSMNNENQGDTLERTEERCLYLKDSGKGCSGLSGFKWIWLAGKPCYCANGETL